MTRWRSHSVQFAATLLTVALLLTGRPASAFSPRSECKAFVSGHAATVTRAALPEPAPTTPPATPKPTAAADTAILPDPALAVLDEMQAREEDLPAGTPADPTTVAAIAALENAFVACYNSGQLRQLLLLMTDQAGIETITSYERYPDSAIRLATPAPFPQSDRIHRIAIRDVRLLPGGRAGAIVDWDGEENFRVYEYVDGRWLIADEIFIYG